MSKKLKPLTGLHLAASKGDLETVRTLIQSGVNVNDSEFNIAPIFLAISIAKDLRIVEELVHAGADVNETAMDSSTPLISAVNSGKLDIVQFLLNNGAKIDGRTPEGHSALHSAALKGFLEICEFLIESGMDVDARNKKEETPLHAAIDRGQKEAVQLLLQKGADINAGFVLKMPDEVNYLQSNVTPVFCAIVRNKPEILDILIKGGANVNAKISRNVTALYLAAGDGCTEIVKMLIGAGADPNVRSVSGRVPLHAAAEGGYADIVEMLLHIEGIEVNPVADNLATPLTLASRNGDLTVFKLLIAHGAPMNDRSLCLITPLHVAFIQKQESLAEFLIETGADIHAVDCFSATPLYYACAIGCSLNVIKSLVEKGANIDARAVDGVAPVHLAAHQNCIEILKYLIDAGADLDISDRSNKTALHHAASAGSMEAVRYLVTKVAEINAVSHTLETPLHLAVNKGHCEIVKILLNRGADASPQDSSRTTPMHLAANEGQLEIAELLVNHKAAINLKDENSGATPLILAVQKNHEKLVKLLLDNGGDVNASNKAGVMPIHIATKAGNVDMVKLLLGKGAYYNALVKVKNYAESPLEIAKRAGNGMLVAIFDLIEKLFSSVIKNNTGEVSDSLQAGVIVNARDTSGKTAFHHAVHNENIDVIKLLLAKNKNIVYTTNKGDLPLLIAIAKGSMKVADLLLAHINELSFAERNQIINAKTTIDEMTTLHLAAEKNDLPMVELLLTNGAMYNARKKSGKMPIQLTTDEKIKNLLEGGEKLFKAVKENNGLEATQILSNNNSALNTRDSEGGGTALYWAVSKGHTNIAKHLLTIGADCCLVTNKGSTPLHIASSKGNLEMVKTLVARVKNYRVEKINEFIDAQTTSGTAAMHVASSIDVVRCLLQEGAMYDIRNGENKTALEMTMKSNVRELLEITHQLFMAARKGHFEALKTLGELDIEEFQAIFNARNEYGQTLMEAGIAN